MSSKEYRYVPTVAPQTFGPPFLTWIYSELQRIRQQFDLLVGASSAVAPDHNTLPGRAVADAHPIAAITGLEARLAALEAGGGGGSLPPLGIAYSGDKLFPSVTSTADVLVPFAGFTGFAGKYTFTSKLLKPVVDSKQHRIEGIVSISHGGSGTANAWKVWIRQGSFDLYYGLFTIPANVSGERLVFVTDASLNSFEAVTVTIRANATAFTNVTCNATITLTQLN